jgi:hypothetical protein
MSSVATLITVEQRRRAAGEHSGTDRKSMAIAGLLFQLFTLT